VLRGGGRSTPTACSTVAVNAARFDVGNSSGSGRSVKVAMPAGVSASAARSRPAISCAR